MRNVVRVALPALVLVAGCGSSAPSGTAVGAAPAPSTPPTVDSLPGPSNVLEPAAGYYTGTITSDRSGLATAIEVFVSADHTIHAYDLANRRTSFWGELAADNNVATGSLTAELWDPTFVFPDGSSTAYIDVTADLAASDGISGSFFGAADSGRIDVSYVAPVAERPSALATVAGDWSWQGDDGFSASLAVGEAGELSYVDTDGCTGTGSLAVVNPSVNGYRFRFDWQCADNAAPQWNGPSQGVAFVEGYYTPGTEWLVFAETNWATTSDVWSVQRSAVTSGPVATGDDMQPVRAARGHRRVL